MIFHTLWFVVVLEEEGLGPNLPCVDLDPCDDKYLFDLNSKIHYLLQSLGKSIQ